MLTQLLKTVLSPFLSVGASITKNRYFPKYDFTCFDIKRLIYECGIRSHALYSFARRARRQRKACTACKLKTIHCCQPLCRFKFDRRSFSNRMSKYLLTMSITLLLLLALTSAEDESAQDVESFLKTMSEKLTQVEGQSRLQLWYKLYSKGQYNETEQLRLMNQSKELKSEAKSKAEVFLKGIPESAENELVRRELQYYTLYEDDKNDHLPKMKAAIEKYNNLIQAYRLANAQSRGEQVPRDCIRKRSFWEIDLEDGDQKHRNTGSSEKKPTVDEINEAYAEMVDALNTASKGQNFDNFLIALRLFKMMDGDPEKDCDRVIDSLRPFYENFRRFVVKRLKSLGLDVVDDVTITQNMLHYANRLIVIPSRTQQRISDALWKQNYTLPKMVKTAENFFASIGLFKLTDLFYKNSYFNPSIPRFGAGCHPQALDLLIQGDIRMAMCGQVDEDAFYTVHHEVGHVQYMMAYRHLRFPFREAPYGALQEAIGDTIGLSSKSYKYLVSLKLLVDSSEDEETRKINGLFSVCQPYNIFHIYAEMKWRAQVFRGKIQSKDYKTSFEAMVLKEAAIIKYVNSPVIDQVNIVQNLELTQYIMAHVLKHQLHEALCKLAGQPSSHDCNIQGNKKAGDALKNMLEKGNSKPWKVVFKELTGETEITADAYLRYCKPLADFIQKELDEDDIDSTTRVELGEKGHGGRKIICTALLLGVTIIALII